VAGLRRRCVGYSHVLLLYTRRCRTSTHSVSLAELGAAWAQGKAERRSAARYEVRDSQCDRVPPCCWRAERLDAALAAHTRHSFRRSVPPSPAMTDAYLSGHKVVPTIEAMLSSLKDTQPENPYAAMVRAGHRRYSC
jgi:hypothetical protein